MGFSSLLFIGLPSLNYRELLKWVEAVGPPKTLTLQHISLHPTFEQNIPGAFLRAPNFLWSNMAPSSCNKTPSPQKIVCVDQSWHHVQWLWKRRAATGPEARNHLTTLHLTQNRQKDTSSSFCKETQKWPKTMTWPLKCVKSDLWGSKSPDIWSLSRSLFAETGKVSFQSLLIVR